MKVAVTDACIFIDLLEVEVCEAFFQLPLEIVTTRQVWGELESEQKHILKQWVDSKDLLINEIEENIETLRSNYKLSVSLSITDLTVWFICLRSGGIMLTSDGTLRKAALENDIETHGLLWVFDQLVENSLLSVETASIKLRCVFNQNSYYQSDMKLYDAYKALLTKWRSKI